MRWSLGRRERSDSLAVIEGAKPPSAHGDAVRMVSGTDGPALSAASEASREGRQRPHVLVSCESAPLLSLRLKVVIRCSPRFRRCSNATTSVHRRLWPSVEPVGVGHSEPPVKGSRLWSLEPSAERRWRSAGPHETLRVLWTLWDLFLHVPTQKQDAPSAPSEGWVSPSAVGQGSSLPTARVGTLVPHGKGRTLLLSKVAAIGVPPDFGRH